MKQTHFEMALTPEKNGWRSAAAANDGASIGRSGR